MDNKNIFAYNLKYQMEVHNKTRRQICKDLGLSYYTFSDWVNGKKYPRMDKVEILANYFGILKSDLIEEKTEKHREVQQKNDALTDIIIRLRTDTAFYEVVKKLYDSEEDKISSILTLLK